MKLTKPALPLIAVLVLCALALCGCAPKRTFAGTWNGTLALTASGQSVSLPLVFHVTKKDDGTYSATMDSPMQKADNMPLSSFTVDGDQVTMGLSIGQISASYAGTSNADATQISGNWTQGPTKIPLNITKQPEAAK